MDKETNFGVSQVKEFLGKSSFLYCMLHEDVAVELLSGITRIFLIVYPSDEYTTDLWKTPPFILHCSFANGYGTY